MTHTSWTKRLGLQYQEFRLSVAVDRRSRRYDLSRPELTDTRLGWHLPPDKRNEVQGSQSYHPGVSDREQPGLLQLKVSHLQVVYEF